MSGFSPTAAAVTTSGDSSNPGRIPIIANLALAAGIESSLALPNETRQFTVKFREYGQVNLAYTPAAPDYLIIPPRNFYAVGEISTLNVSLYLTASISGVVEITYWVAP